MHPCHNSVHRSRTRAMRSILLAALIPLSFTLPSLAAGPTLEWIRQFGTPSGDGEEVAGMSLDGLGSIYVSGTTWGSLGGPNAGGADAFLGKFDVAGNQQWIHQYDVGGRGVSADGLGNVFVASLLKYDADGNELWRRAGAGGGGLSADGIGNVYTTGVTTVSPMDEDGFVKKYDAAGNELWSRQFGSSDYDQSLRLSADPIGNVFAIRVSVGPGINQRVFLTKFDSAGNEYWTRDLESARYVQRGGVAADGLGNVYISGSSNAPIAEPRVYPGYDAFVAKYDAAGNRVWINEFGTTGNESAGGVAVDGLGNVFVVGNTTGSLGGPNAGGNDTFLAKFDVDGNQLWIHQFGTTADDSYADYVSADGSGNVYIAALTRGDLGGPNAGGGGYDVFLAKFNVSVPEPSTGFLLCIAAVTSIFSGAAGRERSAPDN
jgi:hypothetical protein